LKTTTQRVAEFLLSIAENDSWMIWLTTTNYSEISHSQLRHIRLDFNVDYMYELLVSFFSRLWQTWRLKRLINRAYKTLDDDVLKLLNNRVMIDAIIKIKIVSALIKWCWWMKVVKMRWLNEKSEWRLMIWNAKHSF